MALKVETLARPVPMGRYNGWRRTLDAQQGLIIGLVAVMAFMLFWEWVGTSGVINPMFSSSPSRIVKAADRLFFDGGIGAVFAALFAGNLAAAWRNLSIGLRHPARPITEAPPVCRWSASAD